MAILKESGLKQLLTQIKSKIPTKLSDLTNDLNLIDNTTLENSISTSKKTISQEYAKAIQQSNSQNQQKISYNSNNNVISPTDTWYFENKQIDLRDNSAGTVTFKLRPQVLYLLPKTDDIGSHSTTILYNQSIQHYAYIELIEPSSSGASQYTFIIQINNGGGIVFPQNISVNRAYKTFTNNAYYKVTIINGYANIQQLYGAQNYYLISKSNPDEAATNSGGINTVNGLYWYYSYNTSLTSSANQDDDGSVYLTPYSRSTTISQRGVATACVKQIINFQQLYQQGYSNLILKYNINTITGTANIIKVIIGTQLKATSVNTAASFTSSNLSTAYGTYYIQGLTDVSSVANGYQVKIPISSFLDIGITKGYIAVSACGAGTAGFFQINITELYLS